MAKCLKIFGIIFLSLLFLINLLFLTIILIPSHHSLSFIMKDNDLFVKPSDLPSEVKESFSFLKEEGQDIHFLIPPTDHFAKKWMARILNSREGKWSRPEKHFDFYLNTLNFGANVIGIEQAARYYFNKSSFQLTFYESQALADLYKTFAGL